MTHDTVDAAKVAARVLSVGRGNVVINTAGKDISVKATTVCVHSDTPAATSIAV